MTNKVVKISSFCLGDVGLVERYMLNSPYAQAQRLINFVPTSSNVLIRRPGSKFICELEDGSIDLHPVIISARFKGKSYFIRCIDYKLHIYSDEGVAAGTTLVPLAELTTTWLGSELSDIATTPLDSSRLLMCPSLSGLYVLECQQTPQGISFALQPFELKDGPYQTINTTNTTLFKEMASGNDLWTAFLSANADVFSPLDVGRHVRVFDKIAHGWGWCIIERYLNPRRVYVAVKKQFKTVEPTTYWRLGCFGQDDPAPRFVKVHDSRLFMASSVEHLSTLWASCFNDFNNFAPTSDFNEFTLEQNGQDCVTVTNSITCNLQDGGSIEWISPNSQHMLMGGSAGIFALMPADQAKVISPLNFAVHKVTDQSSYKAVTSANLTIFASPGAGLAALEYSAASNSYKVVSDLLTNVSEQYEHEQVVSLVYYVGAENLIAAVFDSGRMLLVNVNRSGSGLIFALSSVQLGGVAPKVLALASGRTKLYLITQRGAETPKKILESINWHSFYVSNALADSESCQTGRYLDCYGYPSSLEKFIAPQVEQNKTPGPLLGQSKGGLRGLDYVSRYLIEDLLVPPTHEIEELTHLKKLNKITFSLIGSVGGYVSINYEEPLYPILIPNLVDIRLQKFVFSGHMLAEIRSGFTKHLHIEISQFGDLPLNINFMALNIDTRR